MNQTSGDAVTRAVVLARGLGTRMQRVEGSPLTEAQARAADAGLKAMMPLERPFLDYVLSALADAGVRDVCLVIGPEHDAVREHYTNAAKPTRLAIDFAVQQEARGTADAVLAARGLTGSGRFFVLNADNYYPVATIRALAGLDGQGLPGFDAASLVRYGNIGVERVQQYAVLQSDRDGYLTDIVEKPDEWTLASMGAQVLVSMNLWVFSAAVFEACERVSPSPRGELELPGAVRFAVRELGMQFRVLPVSAGVLDLSTRADVAVVAKRLKGVEVCL